MMVYVWCWWDHTAETKINPDLAFFFFFHFAATPSRSSGAQGATLCPAHSLLVCRCILAFLFCY